MYSRSAAIVLLAVSAFGPPVIKVEVVANPATAAVKGAALMLTAHHHQDSKGVTVTGRAEGMVGGKRVSRPIVLTPAPGDGLYGIMKQWDSGEPWVLVFSIDAPSHDSSGIAEAVVRVARDGKVVGIEYPMGQTTGGYPWPRRIAAREIDAALSGLAKP